MLGLYFLLAMRICVSSGVTIMPTIPRMDDKLDLVKMWVQQKILEQQISEKEIQMNSAASSEAHNQKSIESAGLATNTLFFYFLFEKNH